MQFVNVGNIKSATDYVAANCFSIAGDSSQPCRVAINLDDGRTVTGMLYDEVGVSPDLTVQGWAIVNSGDLLILGDLVRELLEGTRSSFLTCCVDHGDLCVMIWELTSFRAIT